MSRWSAAGRTFGIIQIQAGLAVALAFWWALAPAPPVTAQAAQTETATVEASATATAQFSETPEPTETARSESSATSDAGSATPEPDEDAGPAAGIHESAPDDDSLGGDFAPDRLVVRMRGRADRQEVESCLSNAAARVESEIEGLSVLVLRVPTETVARSLARISNCAGVLYAEPDYLVSVADTIPSDPHFVQQYGLVNIRAPQGWDRDTGSPSVVIAIVDTGVQLSHPDLSAKLVTGYDFVNDDPVPDDDSGHGTHVAGIAAANTNNLMGIAGVSWGALIMPVKVLNSSGNGSFANVSAGIVWATDHGANIINLSLGGTSDSDLLRDAIDYAYDAGVVIVAAAGNNGSGFILYPARYDDVIAVGATDSGNARASFSNFGPQLDLVAPGEGIYSTQYSGYAYRNGTSMSAAFVSGLAAILRGVAGAGSPEVIKWQMETTALDLGDAGVDALFGHGLIQMDAAIRMALPTAQHDEPEAPAYLGAGRPAAVVTPTAATPTATATPVAHVVTTNTPPLTLTAELSAQDVLTTTPEAQASPTATSKPGQNFDWSSDRPLACTGAALVVLAVLVGWSSRRRARKSHMRIALWREERAKPTS